MGYICTAPHLGDSLAVPFIARIQRHCAVDEIECTVAFAPCGVCRGIMFDRLSYNKGLARADVEVIAAPVDGVLLDAPTAAIVLQDVYVLPELILRVVHHITDCVHAGRGLVGNFELWGIDVGETVAYCRLQLAQRTLHGIAFPLVNGDEHAPVLYGTVGLQERMADVGRLGSRELIQMRKILGCFLAFIITEQQRCRLRHRGDIYGISTLWIGYRPADFVG